MKDQIIFLVSIAGWALIVSGALMSSKYLGVSIIGGGIKPLMPWVHKDPKGRKWALAYWLGIVWVLVCYSYLFKGVQLVQNT